MKKLRLREVKYISQGDPAGPYRAEDGYQLFSRLASCSVPNTMLLWRVEGEVVETQMSMRVSGTDLESCKSQGWICAQTHTHTHTLAFSLRAGTLSSHSLLYSQGLEQCFDDSRSQPIFLTNWNRHAHTHFCKAEDSLELYCLVQ